MRFRLLRAFGIAALYVLTGPLVGAAVFSLFAAAYFAFTQPGMAMAPLYAVVLFLPLTYLLGGAQALVVGIVAALWSWRHETTPLWVPASAAAITGL